MALSLNRPQDTPHFLLLWWTGIAGGILGIYPITREVAGPIGLKQWFRQSPAFWLLHLGGVLLAVAACFAMPSRFNWLVLVIGAVTLGLTLWLSFGLAVSLLCWLKVLVPPPERLQRVVTETASRMNVNVRRVWLLHSVYGYAAALLTSPDLIFSDRLLAALSDDEIAAVCAHELGHLTESRSVVARRIRFSLAFFPFIFLKPVFALPGGWMMLALFCMLAWAIIMINNGRVLARKMEERADAIGAENSLDAATYARALERLYEINQSPAVMRTNKLPHPHLYDRLLAAGVTPAYDRPAPPDNKSWASVIIGMTCGVVLVLYLKSKNVFP